MPAPAWDDTGSRRRPSPAVTLYVPVVLSLLIQVGGTVAVLTWLRIPPGAGLLALTVATASALALLAARAFPGPTVAVVAALACLDLFLPPDPGPPTVAIAFAIVGAVVRGARLWALLSVGIAWSVAVIGGGMVAVGWHPFRVALTTVGLALCFAIGEGIRSRIDAERKRRAVLATRRRTAEQEERTRIARELHDVLAHSLSQISVQSGVGLHLFDREPERAREALANIRALSATGLDEVRGVLSFLRGDESGSAASAPLTPQPQLADLSELVAQRTALGLTVRLDDRLDGDAPSGATQAAAYRIVQEALTNVVRHSAASEAVVSLERDEVGLVIVVRDDGTGFPADTAEGAEGAGIRGMRERAELAGGALTVASGARGTIVSACLPWEEKA